MQLEWLVKWFESKEHHISMAGYLNHYDINWWTQHTYNFEKKGPTRIKVNPFLPKNRPMKWTHGPVSLVPFEDRKKNGIIFIIGRSVTLCHNQNVMFSKFCNQLPGVFVGTSSWSWSSPAKPRNLGVVRAYQCAKSRLGPVPTKFILRRCFAFGVQIPSQEVFLGSKYLLRRCLDV